MQQISPSNMEGLPNFHSVWGKSAKVRIEDLGWLQSGWFVSQWRGKEAQESGTARLSPRLSAKLVPLTMMTAFDAAGATNVTRPTLWRRVNRNSSWTKRFNVERCMFAKMIWEKSLMKRDT